jgi:tryptophan synthase beta chain
MSDSIKYTLGEQDIPKHWYNIAADLPLPPPSVLHPATRQPVGPDDLAPIFPMAVIQQEVSQEREIDIPEPVRQVYRQWRPTPLYRARRLEQALDNPARIYYKYEGTSPAGSHKPNTAVPQAFYNSTTKRRGSSASLRRPVRGSGGRRSQLPAHFSVSTSRCSWSR